MIPKVGVMEFSGMNAVAPTVIRAPKPTPTTAVISGKLEVNRERNMMNRMIRATTRPTTSEIGSTAMGSPKPGPPTSTSRPASREIWMASSTAWRSSSVTSAGRSTSYSKLAMP